MRAPLLAAAFAAVLLAGCTATGASTGNFELKPTRIGWYAGETAEFLLNITPSLSRQAPDYAIDRHFAIEEIQFDERGANFGGDYKTRDPDDVELRLVQNGTVGDEFVLDPVHPTLSIELRVPENLRDSEYVLELRLFDVGWVRSDPFRVDQRGD